MPAYVIGRITFPRKRDAVADFSLVWREIGNLFGPYTADDLVDNYSIEVMRQVLAWLLATLGTESHGR
jgi:hypothetical protein